MAAIARHELARFNADPITGVDYVTDIDFVGDGIRGHLLDVISPRGSGPRDNSGPRNNTDPLPVYVYFHGGGWTSGDKGPLTKYCASQAVAGMVVVNVNYRTVKLRSTIRSRMSHIMDDADAALAWVRDHISEYGGDPTRIVLGGDSAGGQITALYSSMVNTPELARHYSITPSLPASSLRGLVQHCSVSDFSVVFDRGFILGIGFVRMLLPLRGRGRSLRRAARFLSPIEWIGAGYPPVLVTTSERDFLYQANLNYVARLRSEGIDVETLIFARSRRNAEHTWQQNARLPESQEVYALLQGFVKRVSAPTVTRQLAGVDGGWGAIR
ncbi:MAG: alpha/beta hydrolase [Microbacteriaceae bacterium]|jgi:acetyl esterase|nr:alpha/beta hydrolase [Microbacteriaceae bacterium]